MFLLFLHCLIEPGNIVLIVVVVFRINTPFSYPLTFKQNLNTSDKSRHSATLSLVLSLI